MDAKLRMKRIEIMKKIDSLSTKCSCASAQDSKGCANCKKINQLGQELIKLVKPRSKNKVVQSVVNDKPKGKSFVLKVPSRLRGSKMVLDWSNHHEYIEKNAEQYTVSEMAKKLGVSVRDMRNYYHRTGIQYKKDVRYQAEIYNFIVNGQIIATGTLNSISKTTDKAESTLRKWREIPGKRGERVVLTKNES